MHTALYRANALLTYAGSVLAILALLATLSGAPPVCSRPRRAARAALPPFSARARTRGLVPRNRSAAAAAVRTLRST